MECENCRREGALVRDYGLTFCDPCHRAYEPYTYPNLDEPIELANARMIHDMRRLRAPLSQP